MEVYGNNVNNVPTGECWEDVQEECYDNSEEGRGIASNWRIWRGFMEDTAFVTGLKRDTPATTNGGGNKREKRMPSSVKYRGEGTVQLSSS